MNRNNLDSKIIFHQKNVRTMPTFNGVLVVIPTRNRADLAINAIQSVLNQPDCDIRVLVSDNSTEAMESLKLFKFWRRLKDSRLQYIRPSTPLPMSKHWNWAMQQTLGRYNASHFIYLTDRMIFKVGSLKAILDITEKHPNKIISYGHDRINDYEFPVCLEQNHWTGKLLEIDSSHLIHLASKSVAHVSFPRMLNCIVPRSILEAMRKKFGSVFDSVSPDFCFCFRCLDTVKSILYYDAMPLIHYAIDRSNGASISRGLMSKDSKDFMADLKKKDMCYLAPIPEIRTVWNGIIHEYYFVKNEARNAKFPDVDKTCYLSALAHETSQILDPGLKSEILELLRVNGWNGWKESKGASAFAQKALSLKTYLRALKKGFFPTKKFKNSSEAIHYVSKHPRKKYPIAIYLRFLKGKRIK